VALCKKWQKSTTLYTENILFTQANFRLKGGEKMENEKNISNENQKSTGWFSMRKVDKNFWGIG